jgi:hypothetical protein
MIKRTFHEHYGCAELPPADTNGRNRSRAIRP